MHLQHLPVFWLLLLILILVLSSSSSFAQANSNNRSFTIDYNRDTFLLDGKPFRYISGSIHYFRIPNELWRDRLQKIRGGGYNTIQFVVDWSLHEPKQQQQPLGDNYNFRGRLNLLEFIQTAQDVGLYILLRPGPYICAERNGGGLPYWLYRIHPDIQLRSSDPKYLNYVDRWFDKLLPMIRPYLIQNGGPILMTQIENEYGSFGVQTGHCDAEYLIHLRDKVRQHFGEDHLLYTTDGASSELLQCDTIPGVYPTVDFGPGQNVSQAFQVQRSVTPRGGPFVNSEYYSGWLDYWGTPHSKVSVNRSIDTLREILEYGANVNVYMAHGGTSFGFEAGANLVPLFSPEPTSYDYDAPISEAGDLTNKYFAFQELFSNYGVVGVSSDLGAVIKQQAPKGNYGTVQMRFVASIFSIQNTTLAPLWGNGTTSSHTKTFEEVDQNTGFVLYETIIPRRVADPVRLQVFGLRDRATVFVQKAFQGILSRTDELDDGSVSMPLLPLVNKGDTLSILVENQGRIGYGASIKEFKGLTGKVTLGNIELKNWTMYNMPLDDLEALHAGVLENERQQPAAVVGPASFWRGSFEIPNCNTNTTPRDTFLKLGKGWGKGVAWINNVNLGRYWPGVGPQETLYVPGPYLMGCNHTITLFELESVPALKVVDLVDTPQIDGPTPTGINVRDGRG